MSGGAVLAVRDLRVTYRTAAGPVRAVKGVSFVVPAGRVLGLVGESGSGKSTVALAVMAALGAEAEVTGEVAFRGENLVGKPARELRRLWTVVSLHRDLGINLAGIEAVLRLHDHTAELHRRIHDLARQLHEALEADLAGTDEG